MALPEAGGGDVACGHLERVPLNTELSRTHEAPVWPAWVAHLLSLATLKALPQKPGRSGCPLRATVGLHQPGCSRTTQLSFPAGGGKEDTQSSPLHLAWGGGWG